MVRIIFCNGVGNLTYQSIALLREQSNSKLENILFIITEYNLPENQRHNCVKIAKISGLFNKIYDLGDVISDFHCPDPVEQELSFTIIFNKIEKFLSDRTVKAIWLYKLDSSFMQFIINKFSDADIVLTDNGQASYRYIPIIDQTSLRQYEPSKIFYNHMVRLTKIYLTISEILPIPNYILSTKYEALKTNDFLAYFVLLLKNEYINKQIKKINYLSNIPNVLIVGSAFHRLGIITKSQENESYNLVIQDLLRKGYQVFWKPHPRDEGIKLDLPTKIVRLGKSLPIELYAYKIKFDLAISISSSALFVLHKLFNTELLYLDMKFVNKEKISPHIKQLHSVAKKYVYEEGSGSVTTKIKETGKLH